MVEITGEELNKVKRIKRTEDSLCDLWDNFKLHQHSNDRGPRRTKEKESV